MSGLSLLLVLGATVGETCAALKSQTDDASLQGQAIGVPGNESIQPLGESYGFFTMRPDGTDVRLLSSFSSMRNHAHVLGSRVVFSEFTQDTNGDGRRDELDAASSEVGVANMDGSGYSLISPREGYDLTPTVAPDGGAIVFSTDRGNPRGHLDLFKYEFATQRFTNLTNTTDALEGDPRWTDGTIVFNRVRNGVASIWAMNPDGTNQRMLTSPSFDATSAGMYPFGDFDPSLSPNGRFLAFGRHVADGVFWHGLAIGRWNLVIRDLSSGVEQIIASDDRVDVAPVWSPDGATLVFWELLPESFVLRTYTPESGETRIIFAQPGIHAETPDWYFEGGDLRIIFSAHID